MRCDATAVKNSLLASVSLCPVRAAVVVGRRPHAARVFLLYAVRRRMRTCCQLTTLLIYTFYTCDHANICRDMKDHFWFDLLVFLNFNSQNCVRSDVLR